jgi:hypothetical protein
MATTYRNRRVTSCVNMGPENTSDEESTTLRSQTPLPEEEVLRSNGATPLYLAIEDTRWGDALDIAENYPEQIRMWVRSTGTENTTFDWSLWRRLPIHEVSFNCL